MLLNPKKIDQGPSDRHGERGAALFVALALIIVMTFLGFGLLTRSFLASRIAGLERWPAKTFYAADGGISAARARLRVRQTVAFNFDVSDFRGPNAVASGQPIADAVTDLAMTGPPRIAPGSQVGVAGEPLFILFYRGTSAAVHPTTQSRRRITATMSLGPVPLSIPGT